MKRFFLLFTMIFLFLSFSNAQDRRFVRIHISPLAYFDNNFPQIRAGINIYPLKKLSFGVDYAVRTYKFKKINFENYQINPNIHYNFFHNDVDEVYIGVEYSFAYFYNWENNMYLLDADPNAFNITFDKALLNSVIEKINLKIGLIHYFKRHFFIELYSGFGWSFKTNFLSNLTNGILHLDYYNLYKKSNYPNFLLGIKLGVNF